MIWALDGQVAGPGRRGRRPPTTADAGRRRAAPCATRRVIPVTAAAGRSGVCGASVPRARRRRARPLRPRRHRRRRRHLAASLDVRAGHVRRPPRARAAHRARPHARPLAAVVRAVDRRRLARLPRRRPVLDPLREDRGHGRSASTSSSPTAADLAPAARPRPPSGPTSTSCSSAPRARSAIITGARLRAAPGARPRAPGRLRLRVVRRRASTPCGAILQRGATPAVLRLYDAGRGRPHLQDRRRALLLVLDEGDAPSSTRRWRSSPRSAATRTTRTSSSSAHWLEHRNDVAALEALIRAGYVVDTMEIAGRWRDLPGDLRRARSPRSTASRARSSASATSRTATPTAAASTSPSPPRRSPTTATATTARCGTPAPGPCSPPAARCRTTTASA